MYLNMFVGGNFGLYADDTVLFAHDQDKFEAMRELQNKMNKFVEWSDSNMLSINAHKTKLMTFGTRTKVKQAKNMQIYVNGHSIQQ